MKWANCVITKKEVQGNIVTLEATLNEEDKDFKSTKKVHWLPNDPTLLVSSCIAV
jgi:hypothetical protein